MLKFWGAKVSSSPIFYPHPQQPFITTLLASDAHTLPSHSGSKDFCPKSAGWHEPCSMHKSWLLVLPAGFLLHPAQMRAQVSLRCLQSAGGHCWDIWEQLRLPRHLFPVSLCREWPFQEHLPPEFAGIFFRDQTLALGTKTGAHFAPTAALRGFLNSTSAGYEHCRTKTNQCFLWVK